MAMCPPIKDALSFPYLFIPVSVSPLKSKVLKGRSCRGILPAVCVYFCECMRVCTGGDEGNGGVYLLMCVYRGSGGLSRGLEDWACLFTTVFGCFTERAGAKHRCMFKKRHHRPFAHRERERGRDIELNIKTCHR